MTERPRDPLRRIQPRRLWLVLGSLIALTVAVAGCSPGGGGITLKGSEYKFEPNTVNAEAGKPVTVTLDNAGTTEHDFKVENVAGAEIPPTPAKQKKSVTFTAPAAGTYRFICTITGHAEQGMVGQLVVK